MAQVSFLFRYRIFFKLIYQIFRANHPNFHAPRKAWALAPTPRYFDIERFYSFITHTRLPTDEHGVLLDATERKKLWSECYKSLNFPHENFEVMVFLLVYQFIYLCSETRHRIVDYCIGWKDRI